MLVSVPLPVTHHLQARRVDHEVDRPILCFRKRGDIQRTAPPRKGSVVWRIESQTHPSNQGCEESLGLPKREVEHGPQRQRRHDGDIRVLELTAWQATRGRIPSLDRRLVEPDRDVARCRSDFSYAAQFITRYFVFYRGVILLFVLAAISFPRLLYRQHGVHAPAGVNPSHVPTRRGGVDLAGAVVS